MLIKAKLLDTSLKAQGPQPDGEIPKLHQKSYMIGIKKGFSDNNFFDGICSPIACLGEYSAKMALLIFEYVYQKTCHLRSIQWRLLKSVLDYSFLTQQSK